jgi:XTP/dITP diphosphohydrolase
MTVVLLDERWPTLIPMEWVGKLSGSVTFSPEIPVKVRWNFNALLGDAPGYASSIANSTSEIYVAFDDNQPEVRERIENGAQVYTVATREDPVYQAQRVMERAYALGEWERSHTHESLLPYLKEEAAEFAEAVKTSDDETVKAELADVFLQVLFHAEIATRRGAFGIADVAQAFIDKLRSRAPYLFDGTMFVVDMETQDRLWREGKKAERQARNNASSS